MKLNIQRFKGEQETATVDNLFASMTQGINSEGIDALYEVLHTYLDQECKAALDNTTAFYASLDANWIGNDREVFKTNLNVAIQKVKDKWDECDQAIKNEFERIKSDWKQFEETNVKTRE